jgi:hypothetical protein
VTRDRLAETLSHLAIAADTAVPQVRLVEVGLHWILDPRWVSLRHEIDAVVEAGVLTGRFRRLRRVVLYDAPGEHVADFFDDEIMGPEIRAYRAKADEDLHEMVASRLRAWRDHLEMWLALTTDTRQMTFERSPQRYEVKMWVLGATASRSGALRQRDALPSDLLLCGEEADRAIVEFDEWFDHRWDAGDENSLIWLNGAVEILDPTGGFDAAGHLGRNAATFEPRG